MYGQPRDQNILTNFLMYTSVARNGSCYSLAMTLCLSCDVVSVGIDVDVVGSNPTFGTGI